MKSRLGSCQLNFTYENGTERYLFQNAILDRFVDNKFNFYTKLSPNHPWVRVEPPSERHTIRFSSPFGEQWGLFGGTATTPEPRRGVTLSNWWVDDELPIRAFGETLTVNAVNPQARTVTIGGGVRSQREEQMRLEAERIRAMQQEAADMMMRSEMERRERQREAEFARQVEERNRPRRPWDRVRNIFGRD